MPSNARGLGEGGHDGQAAEVRVRAEPAEDRQTGSDVGTSEERSEEVTPGLGMEEGTGASQWEGSVCAAVGD